LDISKTSHQIALARASRNAAVADLTLATNGSPFNLDDPEAFRRWWAALPGPDDEPPDQSPPGTPYTPKPQLRSQQQDEEPMHPR
jgi:hypothetical protein